MFSKKTAIVCAAAAALGLSGAIVQAAPTWTALLDQTSTSTYSLRGIATSTDGSAVYGSFLHTGSSKYVVEYNSATGAVMNTSTSFDGQPRSLAVDSRGYVFVGTGSDNSNTPFIQALSSDLQTAHTFTTALVDGTTAKQFGGLATWYDGTHHYVYATRESSHFYIQRFNVDDVNSITLDSSFGTGGTLSLTGGYLRGLTIAPDGTIYVASTNTAAAPGPTNGTVYKIAADGSSSTSTQVAGAFDLALFGGDVYVSQYGGTASSAVTVLNASTLASEGTFNTGFTNTNTGTDFGYSGLDISPQGNIYMADQLYGGANYSDRLLKSSPVPEPSTLAIFIGLGCVALAWRRRRRTA